MPPRRAKSSTASDTAANIPAPYRIFFLYLEPLLALAGAVYAHFLPQTYLALTAHGPTSSTPLPAPIAVALSQLANLYLLFTLNEALVLRAAADRRVWRALLTGLLVADLGHLWSLRPLGHQVYWRVWGWNEMDFGNVGVVYAGMGMRVAFLAGFGLGKSR